MGPKRSRGVTYDDRNLPTKSCDTSIVWSRDKSEIFCLHFHKVHKLSRMVTRMRRTHLTHVMCHLDHAIT